MNFLTFSCGIIHAEEFFISLIILEKYYFAQDIEVSSFLELKLNFSMG